MVAMATRGRPVRLVAVLVLAVLSTHLRGVDSSVVMLTDQATALLNIKAAMGITYTTWASTNPCRLDGAAAAAGDWDSVTCTADGKIASISLDTTKLKGSLPSDISTLTALTFLNLQKNLLNYRIDSFTTNLQSLPALALIALHYNYLYGEIPSFLVGLPKLTSFGAVYNYLIGTVPAVASRLNSLDVRGNFLTDVPTGSYSWCGGDSNCLVTPSKCGSSGIGQRAAAACAICGTTNGVGPFCASAGGVCSVDATAPVTAGTINSPSQPVLPMTCSLLMDPVDFAAMMNIKSTLGVTYTTWTATNPCRFARSAVAVAGEWNGVTCVGGKVSDMGLSNLGLKGSLHADISKLTSLTYFSLSSNLFNYRLDSFTTNLRSLSIVSMSLHYNYLYGEIPSFLANLPALTYLGMAGNYLMGSVPALATGLRNLDLRFNFLTDFPAVTYSSCGGAGNCLLTPSKCATLGTAQRAAADCAFCGTTNGVSPFCWGAGGVCTVDAAARVAAGTVSGTAQPVLPMTCVGGPVVAFKESTAMLALKASLGVTLTSWAASVPCKIEGQSPTVAVWAGVLCDSTGRTYSSLKGSLPSEISTLTALSFLGATYNYFIGTVPAIASKLDTLDVRFNLLTDVPTGNYAWCGGAGNCLVSPAKCTSGSGSVQRPASACAFCGTTNAAAPFCWGAGGVCTADGSAVVAAGTVNSPTQPLLPMVCVGGPVVAVKESAAMLALKASLGVTLTTWAASVPCKIEGQSTTATVWGGVLCDSTGRTYSSLKGSLPSEISTLTALSFLGATYNYFIGTVPAIASKLDTLDVRFNLLTDVPTGNYAWCGGAGNCLVSPAKCTSGSGSVQRSAADCAFCGTTNAVAPFCAATGGVCTLDATAVVTAGTVNSPTQPLQPMACVGGTTVAIKESTAMLALKASLGVTLTTWDASAPCKIAGQTTTATVWGGVLCDSTGSVVSIDLNNAKLKGSLSSDVSTLTALTFL
ncbi:unnamed protein product [Closterium sp. Naga37s-1]|nr:unnamed protein product [Closterium sp. Naga37s-1]